MRRALAVTLALMVAGGGAYAARVDSSARPTEAVTWSMLLLGGLVNGIVSGTPAAQFKTLAGSTSTLQSMASVLMFPATGGTGSNTYSVTDTSGNVVCSLAIPCAATVGTVVTNDACANTLAANTYYQFRITGTVNCTGTMYPALSAQVTTP